MKEKFEGGPRGEGLCCGREQGFEGTSGGVRKEGMSGVQKKGTGDPGSGIHAGGKEEGDGKCCGATAPCPCPPCPHSSKP